MSMKSLPTHWREGEEMANSITHGIGAFLSVIGGILLLQKSMSIGNRYRTIGNIVFALSMVELYTMSMLYHGATNESIKKPLRYFDHCSVYILIAGSYTPFTLTTFRKCGGPKLLLAVWSIAFIGILSKIFFFDAVFKYTALFYVLMGWLGVVMFRHAKLLTKKGALWLVLGGVVYTLGTYFYRHGHEHAFYHAIFHIFILCGTICHFVCVYLYI
ncbi:hypothetical protein M9Y10_010470 [Tritrichomonas musculus]|uniref:Hemolysin-3 n=1 Tax=Tritrichomonas musculus TaxID=1915356 RepID=A0ABR2IKS9_9EUKA